MSTGSWSTLCWLVAAFRTSPSASAGWISNSSRPAPSARESSTSATAWRASPKRPDRSGGSRICQQRPWELQLAPRLLGASDLRSARHTLGTVEVHVRTPLIFPDDREALAELLRGLGYEPSTEEVPSFSLEGASDPRLTPREKEVLRLMARGYTYRESGDMLHVATGTVRTQGKRFLEKLKLRRRSELARWYMPEAGRAFVPL